MNVDKAEGVDIQLSSMVVSHHGKISERVVNVGIICTYRQDIQSPVKFQAVILVKLACVYSTACLNVDGSHWTTGPSLQLGSRVWQLLMMPLRKEMADTLLFNRSHGLLFIHHVRRS